MKINEWWKKIPSVMLLLKKIKKQNICFNRRDILAAIALRLAVMPFFAHEDIFSTYRRSLQIITGEVNLFSFTSFVPHAIQAIWLWLISLFTGTEYLLTITSHITQINHINILLFLFKLPYLAAEILFWYLFFSAFPSKNKLRKLILFNPILIYSVYMFGRYESFVLVLFTAVFIFLRRKQLTAATFSLITLLVTRASLFLIVPSLLLLQIRLKTKIVLATIISMGVGVFALLLPSNVVQGFIHWALYGQHASYLWEAQLQVAGITVYLFPMTAIILLGYLWYLLRRARVQIKNPPSHDVVFALGSVVILFCYYALSVFHPQYLVWALPAWFVLAQYYKSPQLVRLGWAFSLLFSLILPFWEGKATIGLLVPVVSFTWFIELSSQFWISIATTGKHLFSATLFVSLLQLLKEVRLKGNK
ncbi:MAG: hypothetical protein PHN19_05425 [Patescibacteria group bacterium]|nr:hypothetical protein [Patescibacteria group bacterium]